MDIFHWFEIDSGNRWKVQQQLTFNTHFHLTSLLHVGRSITSQRVLAYFGVKENGAADTAGEDVHESGIIMPLSFLASDGNIVIRKTGTTLTKYLWTNPDHNHRRLYCLDPAFTFCPPRKASRHLVTFPRYLRLGVAYTRDSKAYWAPADFRMFLLRGYDTIAHVLFRCSEYLNERHGIEMLSLT